MISIPTRTSAGSARSQRSIILRVQPSSTSITQRRSKSETTVASSRPRRWYASSSTGAAAPALSERTQDGRVRQTPA